MGIAGWAWSVDELAQAVRLPGVAESGSVSLVRGNGSILCAPRPGAGGWHQHQDRPGFSAELSAALLNSPSALPMPCTEAPSGRQLIASSYVPEAGPVGVVAELRRDSRCWAACDEPLH